MKKLLAVMLLTVSFSCYKKSGSDYDNNPGGNNGGNNPDCGSYNGYTLYKDTEGCYYNGGNYSKVYVDATLCTCQ